MTKQNILPKYHPTGTFTIPNPFCSSIGTVHTSKGSFPLKGTLPRICTQCGCIEGEPHKIDCIFHQSQH